MSLYEGVRTPSDRSPYLDEEKIKTQTHTEAWSCESAVRSWAITSQKRMKKQILLRPPCWTPRLHGWERINGPGCCLLQPPRKINRVGRKIKRDWNYWNLEPRRGTPPNWKEDLWGLPEQGLFGMGVTEGGTMRLVLLVWENEKSKPPIVFGINHCGWEKSCGQEAVGENRKPIARSSFLLPPWLLKSSSSILCWQKPKTE